jgi:hypothetical protein
MIFNFMLLEKRFLTLRENKKKLLSKLLGAMEREVKEKVTSQPGYQNAYVAYNIHAI